MRKTPLKKLIHTLNRTEEIVLCFALLEMALLTFVQVIMRYIFGTSITWAEEFLRYQLCFVAFFGADICIRHGAHIKAEILNVIIPPRFKPLAGAFVHLMVFLFCLAFAYYGLSLVMKVAATGQITAATRIPKFYIYLPIPVGGGLMCLRSLAGVFSEIKRFHDFRADSQEPVLF